MTRDQAMRIRQQLVKERQPMTLTDATHCLKAASVVFTGFYFAASIVHSLPIPGGHAIGLIFAGVATIAGGAFVSIAPTYMRLWRADAEANRADSEGIRAVRAALAEGQDTPAIGEAA